MEVFNQWLEMNDLHTAKLWNQELAFHAPSILWFQKLDYHVMVQARNCALYSD